jgi:2-keto-4-pentenoate hydratase/2-oxohepta-3-ene-1,7-dioic acid hydratase in catechol pathway
LGFSSAILVVQIADKIHCRDHVKELDNQRPKQPFFFLKPPSSILPPGAGPVIRPNGVDLHYEIELAIIMGNQVKDLEASEERRALDAIESSFPRSWIRITD